MARKERKRLRAAQPQVAAGAAAGVAGAGAGAGAGASAGAGTGSSVMETLGGSEATSSSKMPIDWYPGDVVWSFELFLYSGTTSSSVSMRRMSNADGLMPMSLPYNVLPIKEMLLCKTFDSYHAAHSSFVETVFAVSIVPVTRRLPVRAPIQ